MPLIKATKVSLSFLIVACKTQVFLPSLIILQVAIKNYPTPGDIKLIEEFKVTAFFPKLLILTPMSVSPILNISPPFTLFYGFKVSSVILTLDMADVNFRRSMF